MKMYGPYTRKKDRRKHVVIVHDDGRKQTKSWPRVLLERKLGRELLPEETVDHKDDDFTNDDPDNLQPLTRVENSEKAGALREKKWFHFTCPVCSQPAVKELRLVEGNKKKGKSGPYCGRSCAGKGAYPESRKVT